MSEKKKRNNSVYLKNDIIRDMNLSHSAFAMYLVLKHHRLEDKKMEEITSTKIKYLLEESFPPLTQSFISTVNNSMKELDEYLSLGMKSFYKTNTEFFIPNDKLSIDYEKEKFTIIDFNIIKKLMKIGHNSKWKMIRYYCLLMSTISLKGFYGFNGTESNSVFYGNNSVIELAKMMGCSVRTVIKYNQILAKLNAVYINREIEMIRIEQGNPNAVIFVKNTYGKIYDREKIDAFVLEKNKGEIVRYKNKNANDNRGLLQKYNYLYMHPTNTTRYPKEEVERIYRCVKNKNNYYTEEIKKLEKEEQNDYILTEIQNMKDKIRDLSVFDRFDFLER